MVCRCDGNKHAILKKPTEFSRMISGITPYLGDEQFVNKEQYWSHTEGSVSEIKNYNLEL